MLKSVLVVLIHLFRSVLVATSTVQIGCRQATLFWNHISVSPIKDQTNKAILFFPQTPCSGNPCLNGGTCIALYHLDEFKCSCPPGFKGKTCDIGESSTAAWPLMAQIKLNIPTALHFTNSTLLHYLHPALLYFALHSPLFSFDSLSSTLFYFILPYTTLSYPTLVLLYSTPLYPTLPYPNLLYYILLYSALFYSTPLHSTPLHSTPLHSTPLHSTPLHSTPLHSTPLHSTLLYSTLLYSLLYSTLLYSTLLYSTLLYSTLLYSTLLYSTLLYSTLLYSTLLYSTLLFSTLVHFTLPWRSNLCHSLYQIASVSHSMSDLFQLRQIVLISSNPTSPQVACILSTLTAKEHSKSTATWPQTERDGQCSREGKTAPKTSTWAGVSTKQVLGTWPASSGWDSTRSIAWQPADQAIYEWI